MGRGKYYSGRSVSGLYTYAVEMLPKMSVSSLMGYLKGKRATILYEQFGELTEIENSGTEEHLKM